MADFKAAFAVVHEPGHVAKVFLPGLHVEQHQGRNGLVALGGIESLAEEPIDGLGRIVLEQQGNLGYLTVLQSE